MVKNDLVNSAADVKRVNPRATTLKIVVKEKILFIVSVYCPQSGRSEKGSILESSKFKNNENYRNNGKRWRVYN